MVEDDLLTTGSGKVAEAPEPQPETWATQVEPDHEETAPEDVYSYGYQEPEETPGVEEEPAYVQDETQPEYFQGSEEPVFESEPAAAEETDVAEPAEDIDADKSWWEEPSDDTDEGPSAEDEEGDVEEDTEAFLEKVFSELDSSEEDGEEGYGLLRRRRLGAMRDIARDS